MIRFLYKNDKQIKINGQAIILHVTEKNNNYLISDNAKKVLNLVKDGEYRLTHAEDIGEGSIVENLVSWNVVYDGDKFIPDENNPDETFLEIDF